MKNIRLNTSSDLILILNNKSWLLITKTKLSKGIYTITFKTNSEDLKKKSWIQVIYLEFHKKTKPHENNPKTHIILVRQQLYFCPRYHRIHLLFLKVEVRKYKILTSTL